MKIKTNFKYIYFMKTKIKLKIDQNLQAPDTKNSLLEWSTPRLSILNPEDTTGGFDASPWEDRGGIVMNGS